MQERNYQPMTIIPGDAYVLKAYGFKDNEQLNEYVKELENGVVISIKVMKGKYRLNQTAGLVTISTIHDKLQEALEKVQRMHKLEVEQHEVVLERIKN